VSLIADRYDQAKYSSGRRLPCPSSSDRSLLTHEIVKVVLLTFTIDVQGVDDRRLTASGTHGSVSDPRPEMVTRRPESPGTPDHFSTRMKPSTSACTCKCMYL